MAAEQEVHTSPKWMMRRNMKESVFFYFVARFTVGARSFIACGHLRIKVARTPVQFGR